ncbi:MAG TPA: UDP-N-acetylmuramoyl-L-alanine--D-glutamate ligase, partial [Tepidisphaeraceae bacterium]|nr:UDP-N-acetylmuramoyl-L-alanine--D-glutamate ligase [Tepidisphaeraceae bacterium]
IQYRLGEHQEADFTAADLVVASPAIPPANPFLAAARRAGVPVTTEIRLFVERCPATIVGVTGTKGKSTTSALLYRMLSTQFRAHVGGNLGGSLLPKLGEISSSDLVVLELSSYMLHYLGEVRWRPHVGVVTIIAQDHLDWHGGAGPYVEAKRNLVRHMRPEDVAVLNQDDAGAMAFATATAAKVVPYGKDAPLPFRLKLPGAHNQLNAQAAFAAAQQLGVTFEQAQAAVADFGGLPHRLQLVHESRRGVRYYNDSIATIPEAAVAALESFPPNTVLQIVGGHDKHLPLKAMANALVERAKAALCIGATGKQIAAMIGESTFQGSAVAYDCGDLTAAMKVAKETATPGDVVLLSTGCASYDQFVNFEERGARFAELAKEDG